MPSAVDTLRAAEYEPMARAMRGEQLADNQKRKPGFQIGCLSKTGLGLYNRKRMIYRETSMAYHPFDVLIHYRSARRAYIAKMLNPPSTAATVPVTNFDASDIR